MNGSFSYLLSIGIAEVSSEFIQRQVNRWAKAAEKDFTIPSIDKKLLNSIIKELKKHKGLLLVDVRAEDGTEVRVKL